MTITVLIENDAPEGLTAEHGLSLHILHQEHAYLLDAGESGSFADNAEKLGIDLAKVEAAALSHGHYDHANGFGGFFERNDTAKLFLQESAMSHNYAKEGKMEDIGVSDKILTQYADRLVPVNEFAEIGPDLWLLSGYVHDTAFANPETCFYCRREEKLIPDDFSHEQSLVARTERGLVLFNSCSHGGIVNIARRVQEHFSEEIFAIVGGFHMMGHGGVETKNCDDSYILSVVDELMAIGISQIYTGHCTGLPALTVMQEHAPQMVHKMHTGDVIVL